MKKILECENWMGLLKTKARVLLPNGKKVNPNDILEYTKHTALYRVYPASGEIMIGRYPGRADTFMPEAWCVRPELAEDLCKKTVSFHQKGKEASFITILETDNNAGVIKKLMHLPMNG